MADDIVTQLEWLHSEFYDVDSVTSIVELAKAEIERLRAERDALPLIISDLTAERDRLRAAGDALADAATRQQWSRLDVAVAAWREARRG